MKLEAKLNFYVEALIRHIPLKSQPFWGIELCLNSVCYGIEELFDVRNHLAHGAVDIVKRRPDSCTYTASKLSRIEKRSFAVERFRIGSRLLERLWIRCKATRRYCELLTRFLDGKGSWEECYLAHKGQISCRAQIEELLEVAGADIGFDFSIFDDAEISLRFDEYTLAVSEMGSRIVS